MTVTILVGDARLKLAEIPDGSVQMCCTSPPYFGLRSYGIGTENGEIGLEPTPSDYVAEMVAVFREIRRVLRDDGTLWVNLGDSYCGGGRGGNGGLADHAGSSGVPPQGAGNGYSKSVIPAGLKPKDLIGIPWRVAFALQADGWYLRQDLIWNKKNPMPESVTDRCTKSHEYVFLLSKSPRYFYDAKAIAEPATYPDDDRKARSATSQKRMPDAMIAGVRPGSATYETRNRRSVWTIATQPFSGVTETSHRVRVAWDAPDGDKKRTTSPDCPIHGDQSAPAPMVSCGGREGDQESRSGSNGTRLALAPIAGSAPTAPQSEPPIAEQNSGSLPRGCSQPATPHSSQTSKTGPAPATNPACTPSAQSQPRTADTSGEPVSSAPGGCTPASNTGSAEMACSGDPRTAVHTGGIQGELGSSAASNPPVCTCEFYVIRTKKESHFATMPPELAETCIKAGSSEKGQCPHCGAPWVRVTEKERHWHRERRDGDRVRYGGREEDNRNDGRATVSITTLGWAPSCACPAHQPVPQMILDPFGGAGTTALVADRLRRDATIIELNPAYAALARERINGEAGMFAPVAAE